MTSASDLTNILEIFNESCLKKSFESILLEFNAVSRKTYYHTGAALILCLRNKDILGSQPYCLVAYFLLWELGKLETEQNPFLEVIYVALTGSQPQRCNIPKIPILENVARTFIYTLVTQNTNSKDLHRKTPFQVYKDNIVADIDVGKLTKILIDPINYDVPEYMKSGVSCIIPFEDTSVFRQDFSERPYREGDRHDIDYMVLGESAPIRRSMRPEFMRPTPPLHGSGTLDEMIWLGPPHIDHTFICESIEDHIVNLIRTSVTSQLSANQVTQLQAKIKENPELIRKLDFKASEFPCLVEKNPTIAFEVLMQAFETPWLMSSYLQELLHMDISLRGLEVVNKLSSNVEVPAQFINQYIERCILACQSSKEKSGGHRLVRLVCVFLQSLIRNKIIEVREVQHMITSFCLEFNTIKEATALLKLIKNANGNSETE